MRGFSAGAEPTNWFVEPQETWDHAATPVARSLEASGRPHAEADAATKLGWFTPKGWDGIVYAIDVERILGS
jgi:hypothetical protein